MGQKPPRDRPLTPAPQEYGGELDERVYTLECRMDDLASEVEALKHRIQELEGSLARGILRRIKVAWRYLKTKLWSRR
jgi:hypothetical protein